MLVMLKRLQDVCFNVIIRQNRFQYTFVKYEDQLELNAESRGTEAPFWSSLEATFKVFALLLSGDLVGLEGLPWRLCGRLGDKLLLDAPLAWGSCCHIVPKVEDAKG